MSVILQHISTEKPSNTEYFIQ